MPRDGSGQYSQPFPNVVDGTTIESAVYNGFTHDVETDLNTPRPVVAGGTGASSADQALFNLAAEKAAQVVTNYDSHLWVPGSFRSAAATTGAPNTHAFAGTCYIGEALANPPTNQNVVVEARDLDDTVQPGMLYARQKKAGTWSGWQQVTASAANLIVNGDFRINQVGYVSAAALSVGAYGHDQWKAGASGGDYSFTQLKSSTQITIASGKSLIQPIEDVNVAGGSYVLSWTGTAQARAGVNTLTPSGAYAASPLLITGQSAGTAMSVEFNSGTLGTVKLESGSITTPFVMRPFDQELVTCRRYWQKSYPQGTNPGAGGATNGGVRFDIGNPTIQPLYTSVRFGVEMRAMPTVTAYDDVGNSGKVYKGGSNKIAHIQDNATGGFSGGTADGTSANLLFYHWVADARL